MGSFQAFRGHPVVETKGFLDKKTPRNRWAKLPVKQWGFSGFKELLPLEIHGFPALDLESMATLPRSNDLPNMAPCTMKSRTATCSSKAWFVEVEPKKSTENHDVLSLTTRSEGPMRNPRHSLMTLSDKYPSDRAVAVFHHSEKEALHF